jgi:hypothetical protein
MYNETLRQWVLRYSLNSGALTDAQWDLEFKKFKSELRKFWKSQGLEVGW